MIIAGGGFAVMAWREACMRSGLNELVYMPYPMRMADGSPCCGACAEYYRILDNAVHRFVENELHHDVPIAHL